MVGGSDPPPSGGALPGLKKRANVSFASVQITMVGKANETNISGRLNTLLPCT